MEEKQLINKVRKYINEQKMPQKIKDLVKDTYIDYESAYKTYLANLEKMLENDAGLLQELNNIVSYAKRDCEEDKAATREMEELVFEAKINNLQEEALAIIRNMAEQEKKKKSLETSKPDLDAEKEKEENESQTIRKGLNFSKENRECALQIKESVIAEIESSKRNLISKVTRNIPQNSGNLDYINYTKKSFENEVTLILSRAKMQLPITIKDEFDLLDEKIIEDIIKIYMEMHRSQEDNMSMAMQREKFATELRAKVDSNETVEILKKEKDEKLKEDLSGNIIE